MSSNLESIQKIFDYKVPIIVCYDPTDDGPLWHYEETDQNELNNIFQEYYGLKGFYIYSNESIDSKIE